MKRRPNNTSENDTPMHHGANSQSRTFFDNVSDMHLTPSHEEFLETFLDALWALTSVDRAQLAQQMHELFGVYHRPLIELILSRRSRPIDGHSYIFVLPDLTYQLVTQQQEIRDVYVIWKEKRHDSFQVVMRYVWLRETLDVRMNYSRLCIDKLASEFQTKNTINKRE